MYLDGDAALHGTEGLDWGSGNPCKCSTAVPAQNWKGQFWGAMTSWGQAYIARSGSPATNVRVQIRNLKAWQVYNDGSWHLVQSAGSPEGAAFVENFANNRATGPDTRDESSNGGGISVTVGVKGFSGYNYHFWPQGGRAGVDHNVIHGVFTTAEARLIVDDPNKPDDRASSRTILQMGADWWLDQNVGWLPDWSANSGINGGRSKWITSQWQSYNMTTLPINELKANPPPL